MIRNKSKSTIVEMYQQMCVSCLSINEIITVHKIYSDALILEIHKKQLLNKCFNSIMYKNINIIFALHVSISIHREVQNKFRIYYVSYE